MSKTGHHRHCCCQKLNLEEVVQVLELKSTAFLLRKLLQQSIHPLLQHTVFSLFFYVLPIIFFIKKKKKNHSLFVEDTNTKEIDFYRILMIHTFNDPFGAYVRIACSIDE